MVSPTDLSMQIIEETTCTWIRQGGIIYIRLKSGTWFYAMSMELVLNKIPLEKRYQALIQQGD